MNSILGRGVKTARYHATDPILMVSTWLHLPAFVDSVGLPRTKGDTLLREGLRRGLSLALLFGGVGGGVMTVGPNTKVLEPRSVSLLTSTLAVSALA